MTRRLSLRGWTFAVWPILFWLIACDHDLRKAGQGGPSWQAEAPNGEGPAVYFSTGEHTPGRLVATIAARGLEHVGGFALRLRFDPVKWRFVEFRQASVWTSRPRSAAASRGDLILLGIGVPAVTGGVDFPGSPVGTLVFEVLDPAAASLDFVPESSAVIDVHGASFPGVAFHGGGLVVP
jgi:hypothetical protein